MGWAPLQALRMLTARCRHRKRPVFPILPGITDFWMWVLKGNAMGSPPHLCPRGTFCQMPLHAHSSLLTASWVSARASPPPGSLPGLSISQAGISAPLPYSTDTCLPSPDHMNQNTFIYSTFIEHLLRIWHQAASRFSLCPHGGHSPAEWKDIN